MRSKSPRPSGARTPRPAEHEHIKSVVRVRPLLPYEISEREECCVEIPEEGKSIILIGKNSHPREFSFLSVLGPECGQEEVYEKSGVTDLLKAAMQGYSVTVMAYGQTGSGKTYTMSGAEDVLLRTENPARPNDTDGIIPRAIRTLFDLVSRQKISRNGQRSTKKKDDIKVTFCEIYNEKIADLLGEKNSSGGLPLRSNQELGFYVEGLIEHHCGSEDQLFATLQQGLRKRHVASHNLNKDSSRSHSLLTFHINGPDQKQGKVTFVDLAGSERLKEKGVTDEMGLKETQHINKSLFVLGQVVAQLSENGGDHGHHISYRNSKLTSLLRDSLGGKAMCAMITCVAPNSTFADESLHSLNYAMRAQNIENRPVVGYVPGSEKDRLIRAMKEEVTRLREQNHLYRQKFGTPNSGLPPMASGSSRGSARSRNNSSRGYRGRAGSVPSGTTPIRNFPSTPTTRYGYTPRGSSAPGSERGSLGYADIHRNSGVIRRRHVAGANLPPIKSNAFESEETDSVRPDLSNKVSIRVRRASAQSHTRPTNNDSGSVYESAVSEVSGNHLRVPGRERSHRSSHTKKKRTKRSPRSEYYDSPTTLPMARKSLGLPESQSPSPQRKSLYDRDVSPSPVSDRDSSYPPIIQDHSQWSHEEVIVPMTDRSRSPSPPEDDFISQKHQEFTPDEATQSLEPPPKRFDSPADMLYTDPPRGSTTGQSTATTRVANHKNSSQGSGVGLQQSNSELLQRLFTPNKLTSEIRQEPTDNDYFFEKQRDSYSSNPLPEDDGLVVFNGKAVPYCEPPQVCVVVPGQRRKQMKGWIKEMEDRIESQVGDRLAAFKIEFPRQIDSASGTAHPRVEDDIALEEVDEFQMPEDRFEPFDPGSPLSIPATQAAVLLESPRNHQRAVSVANSYAALGEESMEMQELRALREKAQRVIREFEGSISQSPTRRTRTSQGIRIAPSPPAFPPPNRNNNNPRGKRSTYSKTSHTATSIAQAVEGLPINFAYKRNEEINRQEDQQRHKDESKVGEFQLNLHDINVALASSAAYSPHQSMQSPSLAKFEHQVSSMQSMIEKLKHLPPPPTFTPAESPEHDHHYHDRRGMSVDSLER